MNESGSVSAGNSRVVAGGMISIAVTIASVFAPTRFGQNDDAAIIGLLRDFASAFGDYSVPTFSRVSSNCLVQLYSYSPETPWYGLLLLASLAVGLTLIFSWFLRLSLLQKICTAPAVAFSIAYVVTRPSFTAVTMVCELSAFLTIYSWQCSERNFRLPYGAIFLSLLLGALLRTGLFLSVLPFAAPILIHRNRLSTVVACLPLFSGCVAACCLHLFLGLQPMISSETRNYYHYDSLRSLFHDTKLGGDDAASFREGLHAAGWEENDYEVYKRWILYDDKRFNSKSISEFLSVNTTSSFESILWNLMMTFRSSVIINWRYLLVAGLAIVPSLLFFSTSGQLHRNYIVWSLAIVAAGMLTLFAIRGPQRVIVPLVMYLVGIAAPLPNDFRYSRDGRVFRPIVFAMVSAASLVFAYASWMVVYDLRCSAGFVARAKRIDDSMLAAKSRFENDTIFVMLNPSVGTGGGWRHPLAGFNEWESLSRVPSGWSAHSPAFFRSLADSGFASGEAMLKGSINNNKVIYYGYFLGLWDYHSIEKWEEYMNEHFQPSNEADRLRLQNAFDCRFDSHWVHKDGYYEPQREGMVFFELQRSEEENLSHALEQVAHPSSPHVDPLVTPLYLW